MDFDTKQTVGQFFLGMGALGIVLTLPVDGFFAEAQTIGQPMLEVNASKNALNIKQEQPDSNEFARYDSAKFSVDYPRGWQIEPQGENGLAIVSIADGANMAIRTDIVVLREDPQVAVPQRLEQITADAASLQSYSLVAVDGQSGIRIWYEPETGQRALVTFLGYGNQQTVVLTSQYTQDTTAEPLVTQIHDSFVNHSVAQALVP
ncbi:PsbP-related protein [Leptothoe spongobia]|uniref:Uncharacterized protein n=1 Tax=Leptothoe spongobia TAU-MAC 1115 TaxID=1967444 RepID=A0A947DEW2_9CYAN|nr:PsbP-related protein [Leptothoe spongobia]MBT9315379.1 hypothetical protein [Leptothoe spongobia TAU-MAC 1115]